MRVGHTFAVVEHTPASVRHAHRGKQVPGEHPSMRCHCACTRLFQPPDFALGDVGFRRRILAGLEYVDAKSANSASKELIENGVMILEAPAVIAVLEC